MKDCTARFLDKNIGPEKKLVDPHDNGSERNAAMAKERFGIPQSLWFELTRTLRSREVETSAFCRRKDGNIFETAIMLGFSIGYYEGVNKVLPYEKEK